MARTTTPLLVALTAGWCASIIGVAQAHYEQGASAGARAAAMTRPAAAYRPGVGWPVAASVARASAGCPPKNQWLGLPYLNRYANGNCGYFFEGTILPIPPSPGFPGLAAFPAHAVTLYQESGVVIDTKAAFTLSSGSTLIMTDPTRRGNDDLVVHGTFVVQPGAALRVAGGSIRVYSPGASLQMRGTQAHPIVLTSARPNPRPGDWGRIELDPGATGALSYVHLSYAGATQLVTGNGTVTYHAGIAVNGAAVTVTHSIIDHGAGNGIEIDGLAEPVLDSDQLLDNAGWAVHYTFVPRDLMTLTNLRARGRGLNVVDITPGRYGTVSGAWHSPGLPLRIAFDTPQSGQAGAGDLGLGAAQATLTVAPGTTIQLENGGGIFVTGGGLRMRGTARRPIILTSDRPRPAPGDWGRIEFDGGATGILSYVHLSYAGATRNFSGNGSATAHAGIVVNGAAVTITNSIIDHSSGQDVEVAGGARPVLHHDRFLAVRPGNFGVVNDAGATGAPIDAKNNYWGARSGPRDPAHNPAGRGTPVSVGVTYRPWLTR